MDIEDENISELQIKKIEEMRLVQLEEIMSMLKVEERLLLLMRYFDGLSISEIQHLTKLGASAIKMRLKRSRERMLMIYSEKNNALDD